MLIKWPMTMACKPRGIVMTKAAIVIGSFISSTFNQSLLEETIEDVILSYLSPQQFPFTENRIRYTKLISLISSIPGVVNVESLNLTGVGQDEDGFNNWLPKLDNDILFSKKGSLPLIAAEDLTITYTVVTE